MGSKTKTTKQKTTLPGYLESAYKGVIKAGAKAAKQPLEQYTGSRTAGFTPMQEQGFGLISQAQGMGLPYINAASSLYGNVGNQNWGSVPTNTVSDWNSVPNNTTSNWGSVPTNTTANWGNVPTNTVDNAGINAASGAVMPGVDKYNAATLAAYQDPWQQSVIDSTLANMEHADARQIDALKGSGIAMGLSPALGDRMGVAAAELARGQGANRNQTIANITSQGFQNAQQQLAQQQQLQLQGGTSDQARLLQAAQLRQQGNQADADRIMQSLGYSQQGNQADADRLMQALNYAQQGNQADADRIMQSLGYAQQGRQSDADRILQALGLQQQGSLAAAQGMAGLGKQAQDMTYQGIDYLMNAGGMQQSLGQQQLDQAYSDWQQQQNYPKSQVEWLANLIYGSPGSAATSTTTTQPGPSLLSQILGAATTAAGVGKSFGWEQGGRVQYRDLGGPVLDVEEFKVPQYNLGSAPTTPGINLGGSTYINALSPLTADDVGGGENRVTKMPKGFRKIFNQIRKGASGGGGGNANGYGSDKWALTGGGPGAIFWRDLLGGAGKKLNNKKKKAIGGGLLPERNEPLPGTPEFDQALAARLARGPSSPQSDPVLDQEAPMTLGDLGGGEPMGARKSSRSGDFFRKIDPLVYVGLGIMGGESPFPLTNIGQGGAAGLKLAQSLYESELDQKPMVDDSGPTIRYWTPEDGWTDSGIPSYKWASATAEKTGQGTETERYLESVYGPNWTSNPEAIKKFEEFKKTPQTRIDMGNESEAAKRYWGVIDNASAAIGTAEKYSQIGSLLADPNVYTGTGGQVVNNFKKAAGTLLGVDVEGVDNFELAQKVANEMVGDLKSILPGPMSDGDRKILQSIPPNVTDSPEGIQLMVAVQQAMSDGMVRNMNKLQEIATEEGGSLTQQGYVQYVNWLNQNPILPPDTLKKIQDTSRKGTIKRTPAAGTPVPVWEKYGIPKPEGVE